MPQDSQKIYQIMPHADFDSQLSYYECLLIALEHSQSTDSSHSLQGLDRVLRLLSLDSEDITLFGRFEVAPDRLVPLSPMAAVCLAL